MLINYIAKIRRRTKRAAGVGALRFRFRKRIRIRRALISCSSICVEGKRALVGIK